MSVLGTRTHTHSYTHANVQRQRGKAKRVRACIGPAMTCVFSSELEPVHACGLWSVASPCVHTCGQFFVHIAWGVNVNLVFRAGGWRCKNKYSMFQSCCEVWPLPNRDTRKQHVRTYACCWHCSSTFFCRSKASGRTTCTRKLKRHRRRFTKRHP